jgi:hypothetical protein
VASTWAGRRTSRADGIRAVMAGPLSGFAAGRSAVLTDAGVVANRVDVSSSAG